MNTMVTTPQIERDDHERPADEVATHVEPWFDRPPGGVLLRGGAPVEDPGLGGSAGRTSGPRWASTSCVLSRRHSGRSVRTAVVSRRERLQIGFSGCRREGWAEAYLRYGHKWSGRRCDVTRGRVRAAQPPGGGSVQISRDDGKRGQRIVGAGGSDAAARYREGAASRRVPPAPAVSCPRG